MTVYKYDQFKADVQALGRQCEPFQPDTIVGIARGGMSLAHALCMYLDVRNFQSIRAESYDGEHRRDSVTIKGICDFSDSKRVLIVDDIIDSGQTLKTLLSVFGQHHPSTLFKSAALYTKPAAQVQPDYSLYEATDWIDFFWERDYLKQGSL